MDKLLGYFFLYSATILFPIMTGVWGYSLGKKSVTASKKSKDTRNNKMERMNGEFRDREKVARGLKKEDSPLINGYQIFHNFVRPHMSLDGKTPSEACGIEIKGDNKWVTLIQNASMSREFTRRNNQ